MTDEEAAAMMPHAVHLAAAVAHRDPDAVAVVLQRAGVPQTGPAATLALCLADLVADQVGAVIRITAHRSETTMQTIETLDQLGIGAP